MARATKTKAASHDFKTAKDSVLKDYARRKGLRKGSRQYNAYVHGTVSRKLAQKGRKRYKGKR